MLSSTSALFKVINHLRAGATRLGSKEKWADKQEFVPLIVRPDQPGCKSPFTFLGNWTVVRDDTLSLIDQDGEEKPNPDAWKAVWPEVRGKWSVRYAPFGGGDLTITKKEGCETCLLEGSMISQAWFLVMLLAAEKETPPTSFTGRAARKGTRIGQLREEIRKALAEKVEALTKPNTFFNRHMALQADLDEVYNLIAVPTGALKAYHWGTEMELIHLGRLYARKAAAA